MTYDSDFISKNIEKIKKLSTPKEIQTMKENRHILNNVFEKKNNNYKNNSFDNNYQINVSTSFKLP